MSGQLKRLLGRQVLEMGGNAVVGFRQCFDMEESIITARAIGTCVKLAPFESTVLSPIQAMSSVSSLPPFGDDDRLSSTTVSSPAMAETPRRVTMYRQPRASRLVSILPDATAPHNPDDVSPSELLNSPTDSLQPQDSSLFRNSTLGRKSSFSNRTTNNAPDTIPYKAPTDCMLLTVDDFSEGAIVHLGGVVSAKSVKLIQTDESDVRESWWSELRDEVFLQSAIVIMSIGQITRKSTRMHVSDRLC
jgi:hypothetical protein